MAISIEGVYAGGDTATDVVDVSVTIPVSDDRFLLVGVGFNNDGYETVSSVVLDPGGSATALTKIGGAIVDDDAVADDGTTDLTETDGLDVYIGATTADYPGGLIVLHDGGGSGGGNFGYFDATPVFQCAPRQRRRRP